MGSFWPTYIMFELKKYRRVIFHDTEEWCKIWRKTDLWFGKWHEEFGKFSPEHSKVSKLGLWWGPFVQSRKCMSLKFTEELCVMTMKNDVKPEEGLTCHFKIDMRNLTNFDLSTWKVSKICTLNGLLLTNEVDRSYLSWLWRVIQNLKKNWLAVCKMTWGIWEIFTRALKSVKIETLMGSFCPK